MVMGNGKPLNPCVLLRIQSSYEAKFTVPYFHQWTQNDMDIQTSTDKRIKPRMDDIYHLLDTNHQEEIYVHH